MPFPPGPTTPLSGLSRTSPGTLAPLGAMGHVERQPNIFVRVLRMSPKPEIPKYLSGSHSFQFLSLSGNANPLCFFIGNMAQNAPVLSEKSIKNRPRLHYQGFANAVSIASFGQAVNVATAPIACECLFANCFGVKTQNRKNPVSKEKPTFKLANSAIHSLNHPNKKNKPKRAIAVITIRLVRSVREARGKASQKGTLFLPRQVPGRDSSVVRPKRKALENPMIWILNSCLGSKRFPREMK